MIANINSIYQMLTPTCELTHSDSKNLDLFYDF